MSGPAAGEVARADGPVRVQLRDALVPLAVILALGLVLRLIIAYVLLPGSGFQTDRNDFDAWAMELAKGGPWHFYDRISSDYTPGYLYVLWVLGSVARAFGGPDTYPGDLMKLPAMLADIGLALVAFTLVADLGGRRRAAIAAAAIVTFVPITWFDSAVWAQVDSVGTLFLLLAVRDLWRGNDGRATALTTVAAIIKPQFGILIPLAAVWLIRREFAPRDRRWWWDDALSWGLRAAGAAAIVVSILGFDHPRLGDWAPVVGALSVLAIVAIWIRNVGLGAGLGRIASLALVGIATAQAVCLPFGITVYELAAKIVATAGGYSFITVNAYNPWALLTQDGNGLAQNGTWIADAANPNYADAVPMTFLGQPIVWLGAALILVAIVALAAVVWRRPDRRTFLIALTVLAIAFFVLPTRVHERYLYPFFALGAVVVALSPRWAWVYATLAAANLANLYGILTVHSTGYGIGLQPMEDALDGLLGSSLAAAIRTSWVGVAAVAHAVGFVGAAWFLARPADREVDDRVPLEDLEPEPGPGPGPGAYAWRSPAPGFARAAGMASPAGLAAAAGTPVDSAGRPDDHLHWAAPGPLLHAAADDGRNSRRAWFDRSRLLHGEGGGRLDRLDVWIMAVITVASLCLRTFGLGEPLRMHFDEVYHARTAAEFLQYWRYGEQHDIYEYTHPHLAKYAIAGGLVAFGNDQVVSESQLGVPVVDAAVEPRWDDPGQAATPALAGVAADPGYPGTRGGDRLYVATGTEVVIYDLRTRAKLKAYPVPGARSLAVDADPDSKRAAAIYVGTDGGQILAFDTTGVAAGAAPAEPSLVTTLDGAVAHLWVVGNGTYVVAATPGDGLAVVDPAAQTIVTKLTLKGRADVIDAGTTSAVVATPSAVTDPKGEAARLATILGGSAATYETVIQGAQGDVPVATAPPDPTIPGPRKSLDAAISGGQLPGIRVDSVAQMAVADAGGVTFVFQVTGATASTIPIDGGATSLTDVQGADAPQIYAASGAALVPINVPTNGSAPALGAPSSIWMPGPISRVTFDHSSQIVHALGRTPDGSGWTIYAVEPKGNSVFADAKLPFAPAAWAVDEALNYPAGDRQQILAFDAGGAAAAVSIGQHAFAWRIPGVIAGAIMAALLYLLARILFRRRSVAVLAGIFGLLDGMFFVQQRIAMNDTYVDLFIVAALTVFAALWTGMWKRRWAFWVAMPVIGVLLGLALASKWVGLYALGAIGILILARSALGRVLIVLALVALTAMLGYMGLVIPTSAPNGPDYTFLFILIAITLVTTAIVVLHPIAWSLEEVRLAVAGPAGLGALVLVATLGLGLGRQGIEAGLGLMGLGALAAGLFWLAGKVGLGPLAPPPEPDDPARLLPAASPPPDGWLRPGWLFGIPIAWAAVCLVAIPLAVYILMYVPWAFASPGAPQIFPAGTPLIGQWPPGHTGDTLWHLTLSMYDYHNNLRQPHAASSPWWAWPLDLKPVWFYNQSFAGDTSGAIYDGGNLALWWLALPAVAFAAWQAFKRRSRELGMVVVVIACLWLAWSRIDRATFEYHYYSTIPFVLLALAYFVAELWHGPSRKTWALARGAGAVALLAPVLLWLVSKPLCGFVQVSRVVKNSTACSASAQLPIALTIQTEGLIIVVLVTAALLVWQIYSLDQALRDGAAPDISPPAIRRILATGVAGGALFVAVLMLLPADQTGLNLGSPPAELLSLLLLAALAPFAWLAWTAHSPRRFAAAIVGAAAITFLALYPNWSGLPIPSGFFDFYQGILPTWLYDFQFPVNTNLPVTVSFANWEPAVIGVGLLVSVVLVAYSAWVWRIAIAERKVDEAADRANAAAERADAGRPGGPRPGGAGA